MKILVTGCAGFIGFHLSKKLIERGDKVYGIDNLNNYYDVRLKKSRLKVLKQLAKRNKNNFYFFKADINNSNLIKKYFKKYKFNKVLHMAAQAGVRYSLTNPEKYLQTNILGFFNILKQSKINKIKHLVYASTSSIYGASTQLPYRETYSTDHPLQIYAVTKKTNELLAHAFGNLYSLPTTGLRYFTVYGPWGRPDMALFAFTKNILRDKPIELYNRGLHTRDFTYIDDIVDGTIKVLDVSPSKNKSWNSKKPEVSSSKAPFQVLNIGYGERVPLKRFITAIERATSKKAKINKKPFQPGDIKDTYSNTQKIKKKYKYFSKTKIEVGVKKFVNWYRKYYRI